VRQWPQKHRNLAAFALFVVLAVAGVYLFLLRPKAEELAGMHQDVEDKQKKLGEAGWRLDPDGLTKILEEMNKRLDGATFQKQGQTLSIPGLKQKADRILREGAGMYARKVKELCDSPGIFMTQVSRLDYQVEFDELVQRLKEHDIVLAEEVLGISEDTSSPYTYQLMLQLWTLELFVDLALEHNLVPVKSHRVGVRLDDGRNAQASMLTLLPVRAYTLNTEDKAPYLMEFPVHMVLRGDLQNVCNFLRALHTDGRFMPLNHLEIAGASPARSDSGGFVVDKVIISLEGCCFFRPDEKAPAQTFKRMKRLPRGA
jgi:Tfp pilus assembly protein PilO